MRRTAVGLAAFAAAAAAAPVAAADACFVRSYSAEHLAAQPNQTVATLSVFFDKGLGDSESAEVRARFRDDGAEYGAILYCQDRDAPGLTPAGAPSDARHCYVECDGGAFSYWSPAPGVLLLRTRNGFAVGPGCGESEGPVRWASDVEAEETTFRLDAAPASSCRGGARSLQSQQS